MPRQIPIDRIRNIGIIAHIDASLLSPETSRFLAVTSGYLFSSTGGNSFLPTPPLSINIRLNN